MTSYLRYFDFRCYSCNFTLFWDIYCICLHVNAYILLYRHTQNTNKQIVWFIKLTIKQILIPKTYAKHDAFPGVWTKINWISFPHPVMIWAVLYNRLINAFIPILTSMLPFTTPPPLPPGPIRTLRRHMAALGCGNQCNCPKTSHNLKALVFVVPDY